MIGSVIDSKFLSEAKQFENDPKYAPYLEMAENFRQKLFKKPLTAYDKVALGRYLRTWESMLPVLESDATTRDALGDIIRARLGLVALQYATLPITDLASVQPLQEEAGIVYYRRLVATTTRGGINAGDEIGNAFGILNTEPDYYSEVRTQTVNTVANQNTYTITLAGPVRKRLVSVRVNNQVRGVDDGEGTILGTGGLYGTVDYATGQLTLTLNPATVALGTDQIVVTYHQNLVESQNVPGFRWELRSKLVQARFFAIYSQFSSVTEHIIKQRFGRVFAEDIVYDSVTQINAAVLANTVRLLRQAALSWPQLTWNSTPPAGVSTAEHRLTFLDMVETAITEIGKRSGAAARSFVVTGIKGRVVFHTLGLKSQPKNATGPYLIGYWDGTPVYYAPETVLPADEVIVGYRGESWFEAPVVYAPYLPVMTVRASAHPNPMMQNLITAHAAGLETVAPEFVQRIKVQ